MRFHRALSSNVAKLKTMLPVHAYLNLLHVSVTTGFMPRYDTEGRPTGQFDNLSPADRINLARYLVDKVMPDAPKELALVPPPAEEVDAQVTRTMTTAELRALLDHATKEPDVVLTEPASTPEQLVVPQSAPATPG